MRELIRQSCCATPPAYPFSSSTHRQGDFVLNRELTSTKPLTPAAVLIPLVDRPEGMSVILTRRTEHLHHHAGQICFPGGRYDVGDISFLNTALRETEEEIGLARQHIEIAGYLDRYETGTGFLINPVVGFITPPFELTLDPFEVAAVFEVPMNFVLNPKNHRIEEFTYQGRKRQTYALLFENQRIWGATAGILVSFCQRIQQLMAEEDDCEAYAVL